ncbi:hypothetical protein BH23ACT6_BH23ACT6_12060 [soil metagenome]
MLITIATGITYTAFRLYLNMSSGIFERFQSVPIARSSALWLHSLTSLSANLISLLVVVLVALFIGFRSPAGVLAWLSVAGILTLFTLALTWLAVIAGLTACSADGAAAFSYPLIFLPFISSFVPTDTMPGAVCAFAEHQPVTPITNTIRDLFTAQTVGTDIWIALAWCLGILIVVYALAMTRYRRKVAERGWRGAPRLSAQHSTTNLGQRHHRVWALARSAGGENHRRRLSNPRQGNRCNSLRRFYWARAPQEQGPAPASVRTAVKLIWTSVALGVITTIVTFVFLDGIVDAAVGGTSGADRDAARTGAVIGAIVGLVISVALAALFAYFISKGANWARIVYTVILGLGIVLNLFGLLGEQPAILLILTVVSLALSVAIVFFLYRPDSNSYFKAGRVAG